MRGKRRSPRLCAWARQRKKERQRERERGGGGKKIGNMRWTAGEGGGRHFHVSERNKREGSYAVQEKLEDALIRSLNFYSCRFSVISCFSF